MTPAERRLALAVTAAALFAALGLRVRGSEAPPGDTARETTGSRAGTLMEFGSTQCSPCRAMHAELAALREECPNEPIVVEVDVFEDGKAARRHGVSIIPTQVFFDAAGREIDRHEGFLARADILARFAPRGTACR